MSQYEDKRRKSKEYRKKMQDFENYRRKLDQEYKIGKRGDALAVLFGASVGSVLYGNITGSTDISALGAGALIGAGMSYVTYRECKKIIMADKEDRIKAYKRDHGIE